LRTPTLPRKRGREQTTRDERSFANTRCDMISPSLHLAQNSNSIIATRNQLEETA
jgi:hypothetical protein